MAQEIGIEPKNVEAARAEIERTRERLSNTIDEIEDLVVQKRAEIRSKLDIGARIREKPLQAAGLALGAGLILGLLVGGKNADQRRSLDDAARADLWEKRAHRLLEIARQQESELEELESGSNGYGLLEYDDIDRYEWEDGDSKWGERKDALIDRIASFASGMARDFLEELRKRA